MPSVDRKAADPTPMTITEDSTNSVVNAGDSVNKAVRANDVVTGPMLTKRFGAVSLGAPQTVTQQGNTTVYTPTAGKSIRLKWLGMSSPSTNTATTVATVSLGSNTIYIWDMGAPGAFAHGSVREGAVNGTLVVNLSVAQTVHVNMDLEEF